MSIKVNPNIVKLSSLAFTGKEIEFDYKLRNKAEFELIHTHLYLVQLYLLLK